MSFRTMLFTGITVKDISISNDQVEIKLDEAVIIKNMDGAEDDTQWVGFGSLIIKELVICDDDNLPNFPCLLKTADLKDNQMTYRDEALIPIDCNGNVGITLQIEGETKIRKFIGETMSFDVNEHEKYVCHVKH
jgi:hypothetical protein